MCIKYETDGFEPYGLMGYLNMYVLAMCSWSVKVKIYEFEGLYDPSHLKISPDDPNGWKKFANKVRGIMAKCLNVPKVK